MWYLILYGLLALWVLFDSVSRKSVGMGILWTLGTAIIGPLALPIYLATRPLRSGEVREGGTGWNVLKNFAILWTILMAVVSFNTFLAMGKVASTVKGDAATVGAGLGMIFGFGLLLLVWIIPTGGSALLGFLLKKNSIVERGPTGPLAGDMSQGSFVTGWAGVIGIALIALIAVAAITMQEVASTTAAHTSTNGPQQESSVGIQQESSGRALTETIGSQWVYQESPDKMGRGTIKTATVSSVNEVQFDFPYQGSQRGTLQVRNHPKYGRDVILSIERGQFLCGFDDCVVSVRFDRGKPQTYSAAEPADHSSTHLFLRNYDRFLAGLRKSKKVYIEAQFYQEASRVFEFDTAGFEW